MKKLLAVATLSLLALVSTHVNAQTYMEIGHTSADYNNTIIYSGNSYNLTASPTAIRGIFGYELNPNFNLEGMLAQGLSSSNMSVSGISTPVELKLDTMYGIYAKPKVQIAPDWEAFARIGYVHIKGTSSYKNTSSSDSGNSFSYGVGMSYAINKQLSVNLDAMSYYDKNSVTATGTTIGIGYKF
jgi:opacity protein-like surface antigen